MEHFPVTPPRNTKTGIPRDSSADARRPRLLNPRTGYPNQASCQAGQPLVSGDFRSKNTAKIPNTANRANRANGPFGAPPKTRYDYRPVNAKLPVPLFFVLLLWRAI
jgi:hypothetical protein